MSTEATTNAAHPSPPLQGKTALVTGASRGIGRAVALELAAQGARVVLAARDEAALAELCEQLPAASGEHVALPVDLGSETAIAAALDSLLEQQAIRVDVFVPNAGIAISAPYDRASSDDWERMMAVNAKSVFLMAQRLIPPMVERGWGRVVVVASNAGLTGYAYSSAYCASKHAVLGWMKGAALEVARGGVTINALCPGWVDTEMAARAIDNIAATTGRTKEQARASLEKMSPQRRMVTPEEVAHWVGSLCQDRAATVHGQAIPIDGGQLL